MSTTLAHVLTHALDRAPAAIESTSGECLDPTAIRSMADRLRQTLQARRVHPDEPVLVTIGNQPADLAAFLGVWLAGAVAAPIHVSAASTTFDAVRNATSARLLVQGAAVRDRKSTRLNSSHANISYAVFCLKKKLRASIRSK